ncbi:MAG TPA: trypsin-like peptidase domain-containing protein [Vicinamibacterales bacterium]|nr:trypsin-like peptidase domain-containing protein [Vicinamibacterales bacterium]
MNRNVFTMAAVFVAFTGGLVMSRVSDREKPLDDDFTVTTTELPEAAQARQTTTALVPGGLPDLSSVAERAIQASVNISSTQDVVVRDPFYQMFYGRNAVRSETSLGSGVFVSSDGYVVTNSHVVGSPRADIKVTLADNRELPARVVGIDPVSDLAVLKLEVKGGVTLPWGDSSKLRVAEWVIAIGNPFQFNQTVTVGVVSAQNRHDQLASYTDFIQHDAAINPGNSGGALVNSRGELVGINTMIAGDTGGYQGLSFAIPANVARRILDTLIKEGEIVRGSIGNLSYRTITADQARNARLANQGGVFVDGMNRDDPAYLNGRGILPRDVIVSFNGTTVTDQAQLQRLILDARIGSTARIEVIRAGERRTFEIPVVKMTAVRR